MLDRFGEASRNIVSLGAAISRILPVFSSIDIFNPFNRKEKTFFWLSEGFVTLTALRFMRVKSTQMLRIAFPWTVKSVLYLSNYSSVLNIRLKLVNLNCFSNYGVGDLSKFLLDSIRMWFLTGTRDRKVTIDSPYAIVMLNSFQHLKIQQIEIPKQVRNDITVNWS